MKRLGWWAVMTVKVFFDFIDLAKELQPKIVIAENVKGLLMGNAKDYVIKIYNEFIKVHSLSL